MSRGGGFLRDNLEAFAVAIAMALVIRHYCIEAFRIPTGSMMPTLLGDRAPDGKRSLGDRILVDKYVYLRRDPRRFEVAVFQYPLNRGKNFIKRIAGLPGEWLRIVDGDLWSSNDEGATWSIQRKPEGARDQLFFNYYPEPPENPTAFRGVECWDADDGWQVDEKHGIFQVDAEAATNLEFLRRVMPYDDVDDGQFPSRPFVGDVRLTFEIEMRRPGEVTLRLIEHGTTYRLVLSDKESYVDFDGRDRVALDFRLTDEHDVSFANVDDMLVVSLDGDMREFPYPGKRTAPPTEEQFAPDGKWMHHAIVIEATGCAAELRDLRIDRDIHYYDRQGDPDKVWKIPDDHYFMLGDNTQNSKDSRAWKVAEAYLSAGGVVRWEPSPSDGTDNPPGGRPLGDDGHEVYIEADIDGLTRRFQNGQVESWRTHVAWPFVSRDHLIGRAFAVFWPVYLPPVSRSPTRVKLIR